MPVVAILLQGAAAMIDRPVGHLYGQILTYVVSVDFIWFGLTGAALFVFRRARPGAPASACPAIRCTTGLFVVACSADRRRDGLERPGNSAIGLRSCSPACPPSSTGCRGGARNEQHADLQSEYMHWAKTQRAGALTI